jgi:hypothetical protein
VATGEAKSELERLLRDSITKSWNAAHFMEGGRRMNRQRTLKVLWAESDLLTSILKPLISLNKMWPGYTGVVVGRLGG